MKLIKLQNGRWIDPKSITSIVPLDFLKSETTGNTHCPRVVVHARDIMGIINCDDFEQAKQTAGELANRVNSIGLTDELTHY